MKRALFIFTLIFFSFKTMASDVMYGKVGSLHINDQGLILFKITPDQGSAAYPSSNCNVAQDSAWYFKVETSNSFYREFYSTLLTAMASNKTIYVGHNSSCGTGYTAVTATYLYFKS